MKKKIIAVMAVLCVCLMSITACSSNGKNNNSATDDRANKNTSSPDMIDKAGQDIDNAGKDIGKDIEKAGDDVKNGVEGAGDDIRNDVDKAGQDIKNGVEGKDNANIPSNNGNDISPTGGLVAPTSSPK